MVTRSTNNLFIKNGQLYLNPTLTSDTGGLSKDQVQGADPAHFDLGDQCTAGSQSVDVSDEVGSRNCTADSGPGRAIPPVQSARLSTKGKASIKYGKVEVRAKLPTGDWLWPAIWMLPEDSTYGAWPLSGEIDVGARVLFAFCQR